MSPLKFESALPQSTSSVRNHDVVRGRTHSGPLQDIAELEQESPAKRRRADFSCDICNQSFTARRALLRHEKENQRHLARVNASPARRHVCGECNQGFARDHDLKRHLSEVHQARQRRSRMQNITTLFRHRSDDGSASSDNEAIDPPVFNDVQMDFVFHGPAECSSQSSRELKDEDDDEQQLPPDTTPSRNSSLFSQRASVSAQQSHPRSMSQCPAPETHRPHPAQRHHSLTSSMFELAHTPKPELERCFTEPSLPLDNPEDDLAHWLNLAEGEYFTKLNDEYMLLHGASNKAACAPVAQCPVCRAPHNDISKLLHCMSQHLAAPQRAHECPACQFGFVRADHLQMHQRSVQRDRHCGFRFPHDCHGHHPKHDDARAPDRPHESLHERMEAWYLLQLFFKARQLSARLAPPPTACPADRRWTLAALRTRCQRLSVVSSLNVRCPTMPLVGKPEKHSAWHIPAALESLGKVARRFKVLAMPHGALGG